MSVWQDMVDSGLAEVVSEQQEGEDLSPPVSPLLPQGLHLVCLEDVWPGLLPGLLLHSVRQEGRVPFGIW